MSEATSMQIAGVQMDIKIMEPELNLKTWNRQSVKQLHRAELTIFPVHKTVRCGYARGSDAMGRKHSGASTEFMTRVCAETKSYVVYGTWKK